MVTRPPGTAPDPCPVDPLNDTGWACRDTTRCALPCPVTAVEAQSSRPVQGFASNSGARKKIRDAAFAPVAVRGEAVDAAVEELLADHPIRVAADREGEAGLSKDERAALCELAFDLDEQYDLGFTNNDWPTHREDGTPIHHIGDLTGDLFAVVERILAARAAQPVPAPEAGTFRPVTDDEWQRSHDLDPTPAPEVVSDAETWLSSRNIEGEQAKRQQQAAQERRVNAGETYLSRGGDERRVTDHQPYEPPVPAPEVLDADMLAREFWNPDNGGQWERIAAALNARIPAPKVSRGVAEAWRCECCRGRCACAGKRIVRDALPAEGATNGDL